MAESNNNALRGGWKKPDKCGGNISCKDERVLNLQQSSLKQDQCGLGPLDHMIAKGDQ